MAKSSANSKESISGLPCCSKEMFQAVILYSPLLFNVLNQQMFYSTQQTAAVVFILEVMLCFGGLTGCSNQEVILDKPVQISAPETLEIKGMKWQKEDSIGQQDSDLLKSFFRANPSLVGSPDLNGTPEVYHGAKHRRRFYWVRNTINDTAWTCLEYQAGAFHLIEGQGSPYENPE